MDSARRQAIGWTAGLVLVACLLAACQPESSGPSTSSSTPRPQATATTTTGPPRPAATAAVRMPADPWCPAPSAGDITLLRALYRKAHPAARVLPVAHRLLLVGDSTACTLLQGLVAAAPYYGIEVESAAVVGCGIVSGRIAPDFYGSVDVNRPSVTCQSKAVTTEARAVAEGKPDVVLWSSSWERDPLLVAATGGKQVVAPTGSALWRSTLLRRVAQRLRLLRSGGATVVLLQQPPFVDLGKVTGLTQDDRRFLAMNALLRQEAAAGRPGVAELDLSSLVCPGGPPCTILVHGLWLRGDGEHYMGTGALWVAERILPKVLAGIAASNDA